MLVNIAFFEFQKSHGFCFIFNCSSQAENVVTMFLFSWQIEPQRVLIKRKCVQRYYSVLPPGFLSSIVFL